MWSSIYLLLRTELWPTRIGWNSNLQYLWMWPYFEKKIFADDKVNVSSLRWASSNMTVSWETEEIWTQTENVKKKSKNWSDRAINKSRSPRLPANHHCQFVGNTVNLFPSGSCNAETRVQSLAQEDLLEMGMATHSSILAGKIPWTEESGGLWSMGLQRVRHD